ncbi:histone-lysine N-methyltransferase SETMAR [Trichonephila clavipes]|nr:histone-lysine N-methyltransferase SETMAR [Trichonephila clavipes]
MSFGYHSYWMASETLVAVIDIRFLKMKYNSTPSLGDRTGNGKRASRFVEVAFKLDRQKIVWVIKTSYRFILRKRILRIVKNIIFLWIINGDDDDMSPKVFRTKNIALHRCDCLGVKLTGQEVICSRENASQVAGIANGVYGADTVTANYVQFWFRRFRSGIFDVKDEPRTGGPVVENVDKSPEIIEVDRHVSSRSIAQELKIDHKAVLSHLRKVVFKKKLHVWVPHQLTPKNMMDRISICEALAKRN